jgi:hypothetical protein
VRGQPSLGRVPLNITATNPDHDEAQEILDALRKIQDTPELRAEAKTDPESVVTRLGLSGVARHAVAFALTLVIIAPGAISAAPNSFWR